MSDELPPGENGGLLKFIAATVESNRDRLDSFSGKVDSLSERVGSPSETTDSLIVLAESTKDRLDSLYESVATRDELRAQTAAVRGDIEQVQLRLDSIERALAARMGQIETDLSRLRSAVYLLSKERPDILRLLGQ